MSALLTLSFNLRLSGHTLECKPLKQESIERQCPMKSVPMPTEIDDRFLFAVKDSLCFTKNGFIQFEVRWMFGSFKAERPPVFRAISSFRISSQNINSSGWPTCPFDKGIVRRYCVRYVA